MTSEGEVVADSGGYRGVRRRRAPEPGASPLAVQGVMLSFSGIRALDAVDLTVERGEIVGLIGTNGAGKTTLMNVISGVLHPDRGSVRVFGHEVAGRPPEGGPGRGWPGAFRTPLSSLA